LKTFKFLNDNKKDDYITPTMDEIANALSVGRRAYLEGRSVDYNPFLRLELSDAFDEGWELEHSYDILRDAQQRANNGL
jgi:ribosome modulation factor